MSNEKLQEAVSLYKSGDKAQASELLSEIVRQEPGNSLAWYGLALCLDEISKKAYCLKKVLAIDPSNQKAHQLLAKLEGLDNSSDSPQTTGDKKAKADNDPKEVNISKRTGIYATSTLLFLFFIGISACLFFSFAALGIFESPEKKYSREMEPILVKLNEWLQGPVTQWDKDWNGPFRMGGEPLGTNSEWFSLYLGFKERGIVPVDYLEEMKLEFYSNLVQSAKYIVSDGYDVQVSMGGITPPDSIKIAHQQIYDCIKYEVDHSNAMIKFLTESNTVLMENLNQASCTLMPNALEKVKAFVNINR